MNDGRLLHGGLSDRLWGMVSTYKYCKETKSEFKIYFHHPFNLSNFLQPNDVDWEIDSKEIIYDLRVAQPKYISMLPISPEKRIEWMKKSLKKRKAQKHIYTNTRGVRKEEFGRLYHELFKMSPTLQKNVEQEMKKINGKYISCTFRFQQLLGDFKEGNYFTIKNKEESDLLIKNCEKVIEKLVELKQMPVLVTSDSQTFLKLISKINNVFIIEGEVIHPDYDKTKNSEHLYLKSFLDFCMIANAEEVYLCNVAPLYRSGFPETASYVNNKPYYEITDFDNLNIEEIK